MNRRAFLYQAGGLSLGALVGVSVPFARFMPAGLLPVAVAQGGDQDAISGKPGLVVLNNRPINAETPAHLLDDEITPAARMFVRNNGIPPLLTDEDAQNWRLKVSGESCQRPQEFSLRELKEMFPVYDYQLQLECGGNGRSEFYPPASGNQWTTGAISCGEWTGVRLKDLLAHCGIESSAVYVGYYGKDTHLSGDVAKTPISRGVPLDKALEDETLIAWALNGEDIPVLHGFPLRLVCGGWPASASGKWLSEIVVRDRVHDGPKMGGKSYRVPCEPVAAGEAVEDDQMCIIESMPIKSLITRPKTGLTHALGGSLEVGGHAWAGDDSVREVRVSIDFGKTWINCELKGPANRLAWQHWKTDLKFSERGYYEVWARAIDKSGRSQPMVVPGWNPKGYLNNAAHRIAILVT